MRKHFDAFFSFLIYFLYLIFEILKVSFALLCTDWSRLNINYFLRFRFNSSMHLLADQNLHTKLNWRKIFQLQVFRLGLMKKKSNRPNRHQILKIIWLGWNAANWYKFVLVKLSTVFQDELEEIISKSALTVVVFVLRLLPSPTNNSRLITT